MNNEVMTVKDVSEYLNLHHITIYRMLAKKQLPAIRIGGQWRFKRSVIDQWFESKGANVHAEVS